MPFATLDKVKPLIPESVATVLSRNDLFTTLEAEAAKLVRDLTGEEIPESANDAPDWVLTPMAWIITKLTLPKLSNYPPEFAQGIASDYKAALSILSEHHKAEVDKSTGSAQVGAIDGEVAW